jgi:hypothetical protein
MCKACARVRRSLQLAEANCRENAKDDALVRAELLDAIRDSNQTAEVQTSKFGTRGNLEGSQEGR